MHGKISVREITRVGILFAVSAVLSIVESMIPAMWISLPGVKLGLSNIPIMVSLMMFPKRDAFIIGVLKSIMVLLIRGPVAGFLSLCGGMASIAAVCVCLKIQGDKLSCVSIGCIGGIFHNAGQLAGAMLVTSTPMLIVQMPILAIFGIAMGTLTGIVFYLVLPNLYKND